MASGLLLIRLVLGLTIAAHGARKLFGSFGGQGTRGTAGLFGGLGFRAPLPMAVGAGVCELCGGVLFAAGLVTPLAALAIAVVMLTAIGAVDLRNGFWSSDGGYEYRLVIWATAVGLAGTGPGRYSLDSGLGWADNLSGTSWGLAVALGSGLIAATILALMRSTATRPGQQEVAPRADGGPSSRPPLPLEELAWSGFARRSPQGLVRRPAVEIDVAGAGQGSDLLDCLWRHGFTANLVETSGAWRVEVRSAREETPRLLGDLTAALEAWLPTHAEALRLRVGEERYTMRLQ
jgi:putative oxidoreductase